jgi:shikimate kinase
VAGDLITQVLWRTALARVLVHRGARSEARELADEASALCDGVEFPFLQVVALAAAAEVAGACGDQPSRLRLLEDARAVAEAKGKVAEGAPHGLLT